jgi:hypothetical protein
MIDGNSFLRTVEGAITDMSASEETGDEEEPVTNNVEGVAVFANDINTGDFTFDQCPQNEARIGDPRWLVDFVAPTVNTNGLLLEINKATKVVDDANAEEAPEALKALKDELEKAETIFANPVGKVQSEIDAETAALKAAREAYPKAVAKEALDKEIAAANDLLGESATDADPGKALNDAITAAKAVSAKADATVDELKAATEALKAAEEAFNTATGIESVKVDDLTKDGAVYNLNGVRVTNPTKGLYIKNGKKYMVK